MEALAFAEGGLSHNFSLSFRKGCNIGTKVTQAEITPSPRQYTFMGPPKLGMFRCRGCAQCRFVLTGATFTNPPTNREYKIRGHYSCDTNYVRSSMDTEVKNP
ncbi:hypothetical protein XELAEV_18030540mg [Xenopus laevis]|uniref:Uncharacterized protein n=1 Tax=Xenopus laevis TaxID=8355 RepID=A0A974HF62_XENLA|nr:hypothetical protein XELAEV_18030540mg [Xenopus laevis]